MPFHQRSTRSSHQLVAARGSTQREKIRRYARAASGNRTRWVLRWKLFFLNFRLPSWGCGPCTSTALTRVYMASHFSEADSSSMSFTSAVAMATRMFGTPVPVLLCKKTTRNFRHTLFNSSGKTGASSTLSYLHSAGHSHSCIPLLRNRPK